MKNIKLIILVIVFIAVGVAVYFYNFQKGGENQVFCTQEALLCPDGSYVGRHGEKCAFDNCPNSGPFEGRLKFDGSSFWLIIESPDKNGQEVAYAMPLEIKTSNILTGLVGKKIKVFGVFGEGITFKVDSLEDMGDVTLGEVSIGKTVFINGVRITLNKIVSDSRCPVGVQCIWAGSVTANVILKSDTDSETTTIESNKTPKAFDSFLISIENIVPLKVMSQEIDPRDYILTFKVATSAGLQTYTNTQYGFSFSLPESWRGYSVVTEKWTGYAVGSSGDIPVEEGSEILIRHPQWTAQNPRQDIPIMVFTLAQWDSLSQDKFHIGAAPINPSKLGANDNYVFALPARYNYAFSAGWEEVESILKGMPLREW